MAKLKLPKIFHSKLFLLGCIIILGLVLFFQYEKFQTKSLIDQEIQNLISEQNALQQKNDELERSLKFFSTNEYQEQLAKEQLGLQREGEIVVNFPQELKSNQNDLSEIKVESNPSKWWSYLFTNNIKS